MQTFVNITVVSIIVAATELTIAWNRIKDVNEIASAGQTIPLIIGIGQIIRVLYVMLVTGDDYDEHQSETGSWTDSETRGASEDDLPPMGMPGTPPPI